MKKHLDMPVTARHVISTDQFPVEHETPTNDIFPAGAVAPWEETHIRKTHRYESEDRVVRVPHDRLKAGQMVVDTHRVHDIMEKGVKESGNKLLYDRPMEAKQLPTGDYMLKDGHHRVAARILAGRKTSTLHVTGRYVQP